MLYRTFELTFVLLVLVSSVGVVPEVCVDVCIVCARIECWCCTGRLC